MRRASQRQRDRLDQPRVPRLEHVQIAARGKAGLAEPLQLLLGRLAANRADRLQSRASN